MDAKQLKEAFIQAINYAFEITSAYVWEGQGRVSAKEIDPATKKLEFSVWGSSTCEHGGDEDGIRSNVNDLNGEKKTFTVDGKEYTGTIKNATVELEVENRGNDDDYNVISRGTFTLELQ